MFSPQTLSTYKLIHETRVQQEHQGLFNPIGWVHKITILQSPIFEASQTFTLAKLNVLFGGNATGKTALVEWLAGAFGGSLERWYPPWKGVIEITVDYLDPALHSVRLRIANTVPASLTVDGVATALNPWPLRVFHISDTKRGLGETDRSMLMRVLGLDSDTISRLPASINSFSKAKIREVAFIGDAPDEQLQLTLAEREMVLPFRSHSGGEQERVILEFATAAARESARMAPTLLLIDSPLMISSGWFKYWEDHLLDPLNRFQTLLCQTCITKGERFDGWQVRTTKGASPNVTFEEVTEVPREP